MTRILFLEESWQGSHARSMREALAQQPGVELADLAEDRFIPYYKHLPTRIANRLLRPLHLWELRTAVRQAVDAFRPDLFVVYKGTWIDADLLAQVRGQGVPTVNLFPDYSPHAYGGRTERAMGAYDLVISTKPYHPRLWESLYGYRNPCVCVPHGYDPRVHLWTEPPAEFTYDLALCGTWRPEYHRLMVALGEALASDRISVAIAGPGWEAHRGQLPSHWAYLGSRTGRAYGEFLRTARIAIAPLNRDVVIRGKRQPGDEDSTRTYELAAAHCCFLHQRTDYIQTIYDEATEVPLWTDAAELAALVQRWLPDEAGRRRLAAQAHARAVPAYSIPQRAVSVLEQIGRWLPPRRTPGGRP